MIFRRNYYFGHGFGVGDALFPRKFQLRLEAELKGGDEVKRRFEREAAFSFLFLFQSLLRRRQWRAPRHRLPTKRGPLLCSPLFSSPADRDFRGYNNGRATLAVNPMDGQTAAAADP